MTEFHLLSSDERLGFYNCAEILHAFTIEQGTKVYRNFFTLITLEEHYNLETEEEYLTPKPFSEKEFKNTQIDLGIIRKVVDLTTAECLYEQLHSVSENCTSEVDLGSGIIKIGEIERLPKAFVRAAGFDEEVPLNRILKNNFKNGSYLLEFFDTEKALWKQLSKEKRDRLSVKLFRYTGIDLQTVSDRIGNFLFQFPSQSIHISKVSPPDEKTRKEENWYQINFDKRMKKDLKFMFKEECTFDQTVYKRDQKIILSGEPVLVKLKTGVESYLNNLELISLEEEALVLHQSTYVWMLAGELMCNYSLSAEDVREVYEDGKVKYTVSLQYANPLRFSKKNNEWKEFVKRRLYRTSVQDAIKYHKFRQFGKGKGDNQEAIRFLIDLMSMEEDGKVYLWDPYVKVSDILETWYHVPTSGKELHVITSREAKGDTDVRTWMQSEKELIENASNHKGIRLEIRCQWGRFGYHFHDRFLMVIPKVREPLVWTLGSSINGFGQKHHIVQAVSNPQMVVDAFEELWEHLDVPECIVWKHPAR